MPNVRRWNYGNQYNIASFFSKARYQEEKSGASPAKPSRSLQHKTNLRLRSLWNSLDTGLDIRETRYVQHAAGTFIFLIVAAMLTWNAILKPQHFKPAYVGFIR